MNELDNAIIRLTEEELEEASGAAAAGCGWLCTLTDDCPNSVFVCC